MDQKTAWFASFYYCTCICLSKRTELSTEILTFSPFIFKLAVLTTFNIHHKIYTISSEGGKMDMCHYASIVE